MENAITNSKTENSENTSETVDSSVIVLKVASNTHPAALRVSIVSYLRKGTVVQIDAIGANPNYITLKAVILAKGYLSALGLDFTETHLFHDVVIENPAAENISIKTAVRWQLIPITI